MRKDGKVPIYLGVYDDERDVATTLGTPSVFFPFLPRWSDRIGSSYVRVCPPHSQFGCMSLMRLYGRPNKSTRLTWTDKTLSAFHQSGSFLVSPPCPPPPLPAFFSPPHVSLLSVSVSCYLGSLLKAFCCWVIIM